MLPPVQPMSRFAAIFALLALLLSARAASAQSITIVQSQSLPRLDKDGNSVIKRPVTLNPEAVNLQDCVDDQRIRFPLLLSGFTADATIQVWAAVQGADCSQQQIRTGAAALCWQVTDSAVPLQLNTEVIVPVRTLLSGVPAPLSAKANAGPDICGRVNLTNIVVQFLYFPPGAGTGQPSTTATVSIQADTVGPDPPSGLRSLPGDGRLRVEWTAISGGGTGDGGGGGGGSGNSGGGLTALTGINVYCVPAPAGAGSTTVPGDPVCTDVVVEAGVEDGGDGGTTTVQVCEAGAPRTVPAANDCSLDLFEGGGRGEDDGGTGGGAIFPDRAFNDRYRCGGFTGNAGSAALATEIAGTPLVNGTRYAVAVAATDQFNNVGRLSNPVCETPEVTTDFWKDYKAAGGQAGGCATNGGDVPLGSFAALGAALVTGLSLVRRRKRR